MPEFWEVRVENFPRKRFGGDRQAAEKFAENLGNQFLKHHGWRPNVEIKRDRTSEREFDEDYDNMKRGNPPQKRIVQHYTGTGR